jgi:hypothetical protein
LRSLPISNSPLSARPARRVVFTGDVESPSVSDFVLRNSVPFLAVVAREIGPGERGIAENTARHFPVVHVDCNVEGVVLQIHLGLGVNVGGVCRVRSGEEAVLEVSRRQQNGGEKVVEWADAVIGGRIRSEGPGTGVLRSAQRARL